MPDKKPQTLDEVVEDIKSKLTPESVAIVKKHGFDFFGGMSIRNHYGLWHEDTPLHKFFKRTYRLWHADDMSGLIMDAVEADINKRPRKTDELVKSYAAHWDSHGGIPPEVKFPEIEPPMKKSCAYVVRNGMFPYGTTGDAIQQDKNVWLFVPHGYDHKVTLDGDALCFRPPLPTWK
jgi:hypothetical protein